MGCVSSSDSFLRNCMKVTCKFNDGRKASPAYGPVVRLAKRWASSHLFSACLEEEAIELLVAYIFLKPFPFGAPCSRITGFLRFLRLLSDYDWTFSALVVDINNDLKPNDEKEIMELKRLMAYAGSSANLLTKLILENHNDSYRWECLFRTPLNNYDAVILLHREKLPYPQRLLFPSELHQGSFSMGPYDNVPMSLLFSKPHGDHNCFFSLCDAQSSLLSYCRPIATCNLTYRAPEQRKRTGLSRL